MLYEFFIVLFLAVDLTSPIKSTRFSKKVPHTPAAAAACARVKCTRDERPACARLVYRRNGAGGGAGAGAGGGAVGNKTVYVLMLNECEINYVKCHEGVWHQAFRQGRRQIIKGLKRQGDEPAPEDNEVAPEGDEGAPGGQEAFPVGAPPGDTSIQEGIEDVDYEAHVAEKLVSTNASPEQEFGVEYDQEFPDASVQADAPSKFGKKPNNTDWPYSDNSASAELIFSFHAKGKSDKMGMDADMEEYQADCPKVCPARDVMVCARCQHGVYRTFLSVCHMRMFQCNHTDEKLHLATRLPCMMSAPYLAESRMQPRGRVREPGDDDLVLRYIRCSALGDTSREDDPRCYLEKQKLMLQLETYNISDQY